MSGVKVQIFPYSENAFEVLVLAEGGVLFHDVVGRVEIHDVDGKMVLTTDGDTVFVEVSEEMVSYSH